MEMEMQKIFCGIKKNETKHDISLDPPSLPPSYINVFLVSLQDQWGIKEQRTDANRERRARIRVSSSLSPPIGTY